MGVFVFVGFLCFVCFFGSRGAAFPLCLNALWRNEEDSSVFMVRHGVFLLSLTHLDVRLAIECFII